jgi:predicted enzyme related to lactoylglutathione lyase
MAERSERMSYAPEPLVGRSGSPDPKAAAAFYGGLFGWKAEMDPRPEAGGYGMFQIDGKNVAGLGPQMNTDMPPYWNVYVTVTDADETLKKVAANGGTAVMGPMEVFDAGTMGVAQDAVGSFVSVWQPNQHIGAQLVNGPGTFGWSELSTNDLAKAKEFYMAVFGWGIDANASSDGGAIFTVDGNIVCGATRPGRASSRPGRCGSVSTTAARPRPRPRSWAARW